MSSNWEEKAKSNKNIPLIILLSILLVISIVFVCNNFEIFTTKVEETDVNKKIERKTAQKALKKERIEKKKPEKRKKQRPPKKASSRKKESAIVDSSNNVSSNKDAASIFKDTSNSLLSVELPTVTCATADKKNLTIKIRLRFYFRGEKLRKEILLKRENLKIMVKRVLKRKKHSEIIADDLRIELVKEINLLLEQGQIENIEFLDFQPVKIR